MNTATITLPTEFAIYYPDPASAFIGYMLAGILFTFIFEVLHYTYDIPESEDTSSVFKKIYIAGMLPFVWIFIFPYMILSLLKFLDERGLKETMRGYNRGYRINQDSMIEVLEEVLLELKTQDFKLPTLKEALDNECAVDGCSNEAENTIQWEEAGKPIEESKVCRTHYTLNEVLKANHSRFANVMTIDNVLKQLREDEII